MREASGEMTQVERPMPGPEPYALRVFIYRAGCFCGTEVFSQPEVFVGRHPRSDLQLCCEMISLAHAMVSVRDGRLLIEDSGSKNGLRINGRRAFEAELTDWDEVSLGTFVLRFQLVGSWPEQLGHGPMRTSMWWDQEREDTIEDETLYVPEPASASVFPMAELLEPSQTETQVVYRWTQRHGRGRISPIREVG